ncbi:hypothetical protein [Pseudodesulfovibrio piezophilus]|uniref:Uncharacterized protein n=1 Tax=Pseudodesulfovibrio piezophilus (strain DSM 21447 / JCM 15486 / C1TLV30) TaxID=1322246 RepID=M1WNE9_PSEP2|nr:hypothetical protein [Pseudodesulfovibrio piezophilus]CCH47534.1 conserved protein of unknown function [Pseudodesulfovibrio piezophilus C1TLV30]
MSTSCGKVHKLEDFKDEADGENGAKNDEVRANRMGNTQKDMSKVALIVSLLSVLLLVIFFFGMNQNIAGLTDEVQSLGVLRDDVNSLDQQVVQMQSDIPHEMQRMLAHDIVNEMTMKAFYLTDTLQDESLRVKMQEVLQGLKEIRTGLEQ